MPLPLALLLAQAGLGAAQGIGGLIGASKNKAPQYTMPGEYQQNLAAAQMRAAGGLPAASRQLAEQQAARGTAAGLAKLQDRNMVATGVAGLAQAQADQANKLAAMDADARLRGELQVANARVAIAGAKDKEFAIKQQDYLRRAQANSALMSAGIQNIVGAGQSFGMNDMMQQYYKTGKYGTTFGEKNGIEKMETMDTKGINSIPNSEAGLPNINYDNSGSLAPIGSKGITPMPLSLGDQQLKNPMSMGDMNPIDSLGANQIYNPQQTLGLADMSFNQREYGSMGEKLGMMSPYRITRLLRDGGALSRRDTPLFFNGKQIGVSPDLRVY